MLTTVLISHLLGCEAVSLGEWVPTFRMDHTVWVTSKKTWIFKVICQTLFLVLSQMHPVPIFVLYLSTMKF